MLRLWVTIFFLALIQWNHTSRGYNELVEELGCHDTEFRLTCGRLDARIAILEATFTLNDSTFAPLGASCNRTPQTPQAASGLRPATTINDELNFRHAINKRCSGVNYCSFILVDDYPPATEWGSGAVYLRYVCLDDVHVTKSCTAVLDVDFEGFVQSPGYPRFYIGGRNCLWVLRARPSQYVKINFLDVSLRGVAPFESKCLDWLIVSEDGLDILSTCGDSVGDMELRSVGPVLNVSLTTTSKLLYPKRGILFHYKAVGCLTPRTPQNGVMIFRNKTLVRFRCCSGYVFPDTLSSDRTLHCFNENSWNMDVPDCTRLQTNGIDLYRFPAVNLPVRKSAIMDDSNNMKDVVIPSIIMVVILIGNTLLILVILHYRRKLYLTGGEKKSLKTGETELTIVT